MTETQNPLEMVGGFQAYQDTIYQAFMEKVRYQTIHYVLQADEVIRGVSPNLRKDGLRDGLMALITSQRDLTCDNIQFLEGAFQIYRTDLFRDKLKPYLKTPGEEIGPLTIENGGLNRRTGEYISLISAISEASDEIIAKKSKGRH